MLPLIVLVIPGLVLWFFSKLLKPVVWPKVQTVKDKVVLITGASSGLGGACAKVFTDEGAKVILCSRNLAALDKVKQDILAANAKATIHEPSILQLDLSQLDSLHSVVKQAIEIHGHVDVLINNGGISYRGTVQDTAIDVHQKLMTVNYFGALTLSKELLPYMIDRHYGHIVTVSSVQGRVALPHRSAYAASKHACQAFFDCLRSEVAKHGIYVTVISPGYIHTNLSKNAMTGDGSKHGVIDATTASGMDPEFVAGRILEAIERKEEDVILADFAANAAVCLRTFLPGLLFKILKRRANKEDNSKSKKE